MRTTIMALILVLAALILTSCGLGLPAALDPPGGVTATTDQIEQITVSWSSVASADRYYVYRSVDESGPFWVEGDYGPVPYATDTGTTFTDAPLDPGTLYYRISAVQQYTGAESAPSDAVAGISVSGPLEWQDAVTVSGFFGGAVMSAIKRDFGVKDFGALIPGHGGMLDRVDALCYAAPLFFHVVRYFYYP